MSILSNKALQCLKGNNKKVSIQEEIDNEYGDNGNLFNKLKEILPSNQIEHHESDLYVPVTPETRKIVNAYQFKNNITTFKDEDGILWFDIPFAYKPYWGESINKKAPIQEEVDKDLTFRQLRNLMRKSKVYGKGTEVRIADLLIANKANLNDKAPKRIVDRILRFIGEDSVDLKEKLNKKGINVKQGNYYQHGKNLAYVTKIKGDMATIIYAQNNDLIETIVGVDFLTSAKNESLGTNNKKKSMRLNEGAGAGYVISGDVTVDKVNNVKINKAYIDNGWYNIELIDTDIDGQIDNLEFESYEYGGKLDESQDIKITSLKLSFIDYNAESIINDNGYDYSEDSEKQNLKYLKDIIEDADSLEQIIKGDTIYTSWIYGAGWLHVKYDGTVNEGLVESSDLDIVEKATIKLTDQKIINYINDVVSGKIEIENEYLDESLKEGIKTYMFPALEMGQQDLAEDEYDLKFSYYDESTGGIDLTGEEVKILAFANDIGVEIDENRFTDDGYRTYDVYEIFDSFNNSIEAVDGNKSIEEVIKISKSLEPKANYTSKITYRVNGDDYDIVSEEIVWQSSEGLEESTKNTGYIDNAKIISSIDKLPKKGDNFKNRGIVTSVKQLENKKGYNIYKVGVTEEDSLDKYEDDFRVDTAYFTFAIKSARVVNSIDESIISNEPIAINIRKELDAIDKEKYSGLLNLYDTTNLTEEDKKELASMLVSNEDPIDIYEFLLNKYNAVNSPDDDSMEDFDFMWKEKE